MNITMERTIQPLQTQRYWDDLRIAADTLDDMMHNRIQLDNRVRSQSLTDRDPRIATLIEGVGNNEKLAERGLILIFRESGFRDFAKRNKGLGEKILARILGHLGDPLVASPKHWVETPGGKEKRVLVDDEPYLRSVSQLWQYCGHGAPGKRAKGMTQEEALRLGNPMIKKLVFMAAECCMKQKPKEGEEAPRFRAVYEERKAETEGKLHTTVCVRCGPSGKPAQIDSPWSDGHRHADALRIVGKEILRGLWLEARLLHGID